MGSRLPLFLVCCVAGCATIDADEAVSELPYRCSDLVVVGRVATLSGESLGEPAPLPNRPRRWQLQVKIKRVVRGSESRAVVPASAVSHGRIRGDRDFLAVLTPAEPGGYVLQTAALWDVTPRPRLAEPCS